jgi:hypothetical protein
MSASDSQKDNINIHKFAGQSPPADTTRDLGQTEFIKRSAAETLEESDKALAPQTTEFGLPVQEMLGVIAYCYVKGVFCSPDIAELLKNDPTLRSKFGRKLPDGDTVRRFRRRYAAEIEDVLEDVFRAFPEGKLPEGKQTEFIHRQAAELLHDAVRTDNTRRGLS